MTEEEKVPQRVTQVYRELGAPNPPDVLDEAILAASRRPPALSTRTWTQRWAVPLSLAAVLVLSVTVTLRMQYEQPELEAPAQTAKQSAPVPASPAPPAAEAQLRLKTEDQVKATTSAPARERTAKIAVPDERRKNELRDEPKAFAEQRREQAPTIASAPAPMARPAPAAAAPVAPAAAPAVSSRADSPRSAESSVAGGAARQMDERTARDGEAAARAPQVGPVEALAKRGQLSAAKAAVESPERELERIAQLRREGRHEEADKALAEFRKRLPDYRIPDAMLERVERR